MRKRADDDGSDLLLIDTGDRVEGNGLYDASDPKGNYTLGILGQQKMDVVSIGNHELYQYNTSDREYEHVVREFKGAYIASNIDVYDPNSSNGTFVPLAPRFRKFKTKNQGIRIVAFGFLFDFHGNANNTVVQPVAETVKEDWFKDAIRDKDVDLFLVAGHVPVRNTPEFDLIYSKIRAAQWDTPIVFFGGHTHIRDFRKWENKAYGMESGRYMETIGFLSVSGLSNSGKQKDVTAATKSMKYKRLYIDNNLYSFQHHSNTNESSFPTKLGKNVSATIDEARRELKLDHIFGCAPKDYWINRAPYPANDSMLTWLEKKVLPDAFETANASKSIVITNSGALRFDIFKGPFTTDSTFLVSPFTSGFNKIKNVPYAAASQVLKLLNNAGQIPLTDLLALAGEESWGRYKLDELIPHPPPKANKIKTQTTPHTSDPVEQNISSYPDHQQVPLGQTILKDDDKDDDDDDDDDKPTLSGYTTNDDAGSDGDDTIHAPIKFYNVPNCIGVNIGFDDDDLPNSKKDDDRNNPPEDVNLIYNDFIEDWVLLALRYAGVRYGAENAAPALDGKTLTDVISDWVAENWPCDEKKE